MLTGIVTAGILIILMLLFPLFDESLQTVTAISNPDSGIGNNNDTNNTLSFQIHTYTSVVQVQSTLIGFRLQRG